MTALLLIGAGGHAKVLHALAQAAGLRIAGVCDPALAQQHVKEWRGLPVIGGDDALASHSPREFGLILGVGQLVGSARRAEIATRLERLGYSFPALVHPAAWIADDVELGPGVQVMAGAVIQPDCRIGEHTIVNTRASIDHDCTVGAFVHVAPAATLCGGVSVGDHAFIGSGAIVAQGIRVGTRAIAGAGVAVVRDLEEGRKIIGAPSRLNQER
jgi:UDP-perosamine 4-acetyltransferase